MMKLVEVAYASDWYLKPLDWEDLAYLYPLQDRPWDEFAKAYQEELHFVVIRKDIPMGILSLMQVEDGAIETGLWLGAEFQSHGYGTLLRCIALEIIFGPLAADIALSQNFADNPRPGQISQKLGYEHLYIKEDLERPIDVYCLTRQQWELSKAYYACDSSLLNIN